MQAVQAACAEAVEFIKSQLPNVTWTGSVIMAKGDKIYVNRGSREGVSVGQTFTIGEVEVLRANRDRVVIHDGVEPGERICVTRLDVVSEGMQVKVAETPSEGKR